MFSPSYRPIFIHVRHQASLPLYLSLFAFCWKKSLSLFNVLSIFLDIKVVFPHVSHKFQMYQINSYLNSACSSDFFLNYIVPHLYKTIVFSISFTEMYQCQINFPLHLWGSSQAFVIQHIIHKSSALFFRSTELWIYLKKVSIF